MKVARSVLIVLHHLSSLSGGGGISSTLGTSLLASVVLDVGLSNLTSVLALFAGPGAGLASVATTATSVGVVVFSTLAASEAASSTTETSAMMSS